MGQQIQQKPTTKSSGVANKKAVNVEKKIDDINIKLQGLDMQLV
jgi:hypothetical protein